MVPHDAVRKNSHGDSDGGFRDNEQKCAEVTGLVEQRLAMIATVENVLHKAVGRNALTSRHATAQSTSMPGRREKGTVPFSATGNGDCPLYQDRPTMSPDGVRVMVSAAGV